MDLVTGRWEHEQVQAEAEMREKISIRQRIFLKLQK